MGTSSKALWIPFLWMVLAGSRYVSQWLNLVLPGSETDLYNEGSEVDRTVFLLLILASVVVLAWRRLNWNEILKNNVWILPYFIFCTLSILWADDPFISFKRWTKLAGVIGMALIILSEERPYEALGIILRRLAYLLIPLSILFIRYYPDLGRGYNPDGGLMYTGATLHKNSLGVLCLITGIYFCWNLIANHQEGNKSQNRLINFIFLLVIAWLLYMSSSATARVCLVIAICIFLISRVPAMVQNPSRNITMIIVLFLFYGVLEFMFDITNNVITMLGRSSDLTNRVPIWEMLLVMVKDPLLGAGYESFWSGERLLEIWDKVGANIITAHNGYLDTYFEVGIVGLLFAVIIIIYGIRNAAEYLNHEYSYAILRISIIFVFALYNWTESAFIPLNNVFLLFWVSILNPATAKLSRPEKIEIQ